METVNMRRIDDPMYMFRKGDIVIGVRLCKIALGAFICVCTVDASAIGGAAENAYTQ
jgi:hypothetical protein